MTSITAIRGDITTLDVDVIVNAANSGLMGGGGVDGAIHRSGGAIVRKQCQEWILANGPLPTGEVMMTDAGEMPSRHIIHTVGPIYGMHHDSENRRLLSNCYRNALDLTFQTGARSVAFPNISTGIYGYPKREAGMAAVETVSDWTATNGGLDAIVFVCHDPDNLAVYSRLLGRSGWPAGMEEELHRPPDS